MRKFSLVLLVLAVWIGCQKQIEVTPKEKSIEVIKKRAEVFIAGDGSVVVGNVEGLKGITVKEITWKKDGSQMVRIPLRFVKPVVYDEFGGLVQAEKVTSPPFFMDTCEVTVGQYKKFLQSSGYETTNTINWNQVTSILPLTNIQ